jgi:N-acetylmuramoyl-L-alanine amidase
MAPVKVDNSNAVYLSPSNQSDNEYACDSKLTEKDEMHAVAERAKYYLEKEGIKVYIAAKDFSLDDKLSFAEDLGVGVYVSIHSNAGDGGYGTECFYNSNNAGSLDLAKNVYGSVAKLTPTDDRGMVDGNLTQLRETITPTMPNCLVEVEFHDKEDTSRWITENIDKLGKAIADGIIKYREEASIGDSGIK